VRLACLCSQFISLCSSSVIAADEHLDDGVPLLALLALLGGAVLGWRPGRALAPVLTVPAARRTCWCLRWCLAELQASSHPFVTVWECDLAGDVGTPAHPDYELTVYVLPGQSRHPRAWCACSPAGVHFRTGDRMRPSSDFHNNRAPCSAIQRAMVGQRALSM
jgi:hypothetical protein